MARKPDTDLQPPKGGAKPGRDTMSPLRGKIQNPPPRGKSEVKQGLTTRWTHTDLRKKS